MENASKALIIAASILIAILIIALGVTIFNKAQDAASTESLDTAEINMFNQKFEKYSTGASEDILGSQVKTLISTLISNASTNKDDPIKVPTIKGDVVNSIVHKEILGGRDSTGKGRTFESNELKTYISDLSSLKNGINSTHSYEVTCSYGTSGLISTITIK